MAVSIILVDLESLVQQSFSLTPCSCQELRLQRETNRETYE